MLGRLFSPRSRQSRSLEDPPEATRTANGNKDDHLPIRRSDPRVTKAPLSDVGRQICHAMRRCALFLLTTSLFAISINVFFNSIKWFFHLPQNATIRNETMELNDVSQTKDSSVNSLPLCSRGLSPPHNMQPIPLSRGSDYRFLLKALTC